MREETNDKESRSFFFFELKLKGKGKRKSKPFSTGLALELLLRDWFVRKGKEKKFCLNCAHLVYFYVIDDIQIY